MTNHIPNKDGWLDINDQQPQDDQWVEVCTGNEITTDFQVSVRWEAGWASVYRYWRPREEIK